jgi:hypothetical protein
MLLQGARLTYRYAIIRVRLQAHLKWQAQQSSRDQKKMVRWMTDPTRVSGAGMSRSLPLERVFMRAESELHRPAQLRIVGGLLDAAFGGPSPDPEIDRLLSRLEHCGELTIRGR